MKKGKILFDSNKDSDIETISDLMKERNPSNEWEAEVINFGWRRARGVKDKFVAETSRALLEKILPRTDCNFIIYELDKRGFAVQNFHHDNNTGNEWYHILPACQEGYHRDWDKDGICVREK
jgi:hypothetical protein